jgi:hypothetical protein
LQRRWHCAHILRTHRTCDGGPVCICRCQLDASTHMQSAMLSASQPYVANACANRCWQHRTLKGVPQ